MEVVVNRTTEREARFNKENLLRDFVRFSWRATRGLTTAAEAEGQELVQRMMQIGRITPEEGDRLMSTLESRMKRSRESFEASVEASVRRAVEKIRELSSRELADLQEQAARLEARLEALLAKKAN